MTLRSFTPNHITTLNLGAQTIFQYFRYTALTRMKYFLSRDPEHCQITLNRIKKTPQIIKAHFESNLNAWCFATQRHGLDNNFMSFLSESWHCPIDRGWEYGFKHLQVLSNQIISVSSMTILSFYIVKTFFSPSFFDIDQMTLRWDQNTSTWDKQHYFKGDSLELFHSKYTICKYM